MGKNRRYRNVYQITVSGTTTNGTGAKLSDNFIKTVVRALATNWNYKVEVDIKVLETKGDYDAEKGELRENV